MTSTKDTILFVHGAWHGKWCWDKHFRKAFESKGYNVITFDLPGHDQREKVRGINKYTISDYVDALKAQVDQLETPPIIVGHSMGGLVLQKYLEKHKCKKAILMASVPPFGVIKVTLKFAKKWYFYPSLLGLNLYGLVDSLKKSKEAFFSNDIADNELKEYTNQLCSESFLAFLNMLIPRVRVNHSAHIPMLVLGAANDTIFSIRDNEITAKKHNAELIILDDIAHDMMLDVYHKKASDAIMKWLGK